MLEKTVNTVNKPGEPGTTVGYVGEYDGTIDLCWIEVCLNEGFNGEDVKL